MLAEIASMYYEQNLTQSEIADRLFISRTRISRLLKSAQEKGIVKFTIEHVSERSYELEEIIKRAYHMKEVYILNNQNVDYDHILVQMGRLAAAYLDKRIQSARVIGISWGRSIAATINSLQGFPHKNLEIVQIIGGTLVQNPVIDIAGITQKIVNKYNATGIYLNSPLYMADESAAESLRRQPVISFALDKARKADLVISGIGSPGSETFSYMFDGYHNEAELEEVVASGAAGFMCAQAFDLAGNPLQTGFNDRVIGLSLNDLKSIDTVVAISGGKQKASAVLGALRGGYCNVLVTDRSCITEICKLDRNFLLSDN